MTIEQIAKMAKVSKATVSRVINGRPGPSVATVRRVKAVIDKVGYAPEPIGRRRGMRKQVAAALRYRQVALIMVDDGYLAHPGIFAQLVLGIGTALAERGLMMVMVNHPTRLPQAVRQGEIDGMLLAGGAISPEHRRTLPDVPSIWLTSHGDHRDSYVMPGNEVAGQLAAEYLLEHTEGPLASVNFEPSYLALHRRNHAFRLTVEAAGRPYVPLNASRRPSIRMATARQIYDLLRPVAERIAAMDPPLGGLFSPNDRVTAHLQPLLLREGIRPVLDLPLVSCGNEQCYLAAMDPPPVTVDLAQEVVGRRAVEHLLHRITSGQKRAESLALGAELIVPDGLASALAGASAST